MKLTQRFTGTSNRQLRADSLIRRSIEAEAKGKFVKADRLMAKAAETEKNLRPRTWKS